MIRNTSVWKMALAATMVALIIAACGGNTSVTPIDANVKTIEAGRDVGKEPGPDAPGGNNNGHKQAQKPANETKAGVASTDCVSPFQNTQLITADDAPRCDCQAGTVACVNNVQFVCTSSWAGVPVTDCGTPNACVDIANVSFSATTLQPCVSGSGAYDCTWTIDFRLSLAPSFLIGRGYGPNTTGKYHCDGLSIVLETGATPKVATYDPATRTISMDGVKYQPKP